MHALKRTRAVPGLLLALLVAAALAVALAGAAHNADGSPVTFGHAKSHVVDNGDGSQDVVTDVSTQTVDLTGKTSLVVVGTNSRSRVLGGVGVWNMKIWYDTAPAGANYTTYQTSFFNPGNHYSIIYFKMWGPNGAGREVGGAISNDVIYNTDYFVGASTTKAESDSAYLTSDGSHVNPSGCIYLTPYDSNETGTDCSV